MISVSFSLNSVIANMKVAERLAFLVSLVMFCCYFVCFCQATNTLIPGDILRNNQTLVSAGGLFELGFFGSGGSSSNHYLGIWLKNVKDKKAVWVANRDNPILDDSGILTIRYDGNMVITDIRVIPIIVNYGMLATSSNTSAKLLDSGNLILVDEEENVVWQSFDYPSDTFLPGMKLGLFDLDTDHIRKQFLVSWLSPLVPTTGPFALGLDSNNRTFFNAWRRDGVFQHIGFWTGHSFKFFFQSTSDSYNFTFVSTSKEIYLTFDTPEDGNFSWFVLTSTGEIDEFTMLDQGIAIINHTLCEGTAVSKGCLIPMPSMCGDNDKFSEIKGSMPNSMIVSESVRMGPSDCEIMCRSNCACTAYASFHDDGTGCQLYYGDKKDFLNIIGKGNEIIYIRGDAPTNSDIGRKRKLLLIVIVPVVSFLMLIIISAPSYLRYRKYTYIAMTKKQDAIRESASLLLFQFGTNVAAINEEDNANGLELSRKKVHEPPLLSFSCIAAATNNFSFANKLGEGGFGPVYKGKLLGHEIAVKRLSRLSGQGIEEFKNELQLISMLQHRNLVRLLGYCIQQEEKILIYGYMPNNSLGSFIFGADLTKRTLLAWSKRLHIIDGIAQGLLYLHKYSRLKIIHRDLKTSNILLDSHMNPKISDFGMARIFDEDRSQAKTKRVVGTYGYMSPEYAVHGIFSTKSDVFSFGVIILEIISGRKNTVFFESDRSWNLLGYAYHLWKDGRCMELMDPTLAESCLLGELMLFIQVALLCIQECANDRPNMSDVVSMLSNERTNLPTPKQPAFSTHLIVIDDLRRRGQKISSNGITFSAVEAR